MNHSKFFLLCQEPRREYPIKCAIQCAFEEYLNGLSDKRGPILFPLHKINLPCCPVEQVYCLPRQWLTIRSSRPLFHTHLGSTLNSVFHTVAAFGTHTDLHRFSLCFQFLLTTSPSHRTQRCVTSFSTVSSRLKCSLAIPKLAISYCVTLRRRSHVQYIAYAYPKTIASLWFHGSEIPKQVRYPH